jgi:hypothetical protein
MQKKWGCQTISGERHLGGSYGWKPMGYSSYSGLVLPIV